jgi:hypothetical protein
MCRMLRREIAYRVTRLCDIPHMSVPIDAAFYVMTGLRRSECSEINDLTIGSKHA